MTTERNSRNRAVPGTRPAARNTRPAARNVRQASGTRPAARNTRPAARIAAQGRRPAQTRQSVRQGGPRRRVLPPQARLVLLAVVTVLVIFGVVRLIQTAAENSKERFLDNVYVNGVALAGFTRDEGYAAVGQAKEQRINTTYNLTYNDQTYSFKPTDFGVDLDYESEMERAWNLGHVGDSATINQLKQNLK